MGRAAEEQRCTFYTADAAELCMSYVTNHKIVKKKKRGTDEYVRNKYEFYSSKTYTWLQYNKRQIHVPGTTFSNFGDEVWWKEVPATDVASPHSRACTKGPISSLRNIGLTEKFGARAE